MVELRKRKAAPAEPEKPAKKAVKAKGAAKKEKDTAPTEEKEEEKAEGKAAPQKATTGSVVELKDFGGQVETHDGNKVTLGELVENSKGGVVLFTYPKASTPGCTTQACLFRDSYDPITKAGYDVFGLSADSPKSNTNFKAKQNLQYTLLCDPSFGLIKAIGLRKAGGGTQRGVFVVDKDGKVLAAEPGGPQATLDAVIKVVQSKDGGKK